MNLPNFTTLSRNKQGTSAYYLSQAASIKTVTQTVNANGVNKWTQQNFVPLNTFKTHQDSRILLCWTVKNRGQCEQKEFLGEAVEVTVNLDLYSVLSAVTN